MFPNGYGHNGLPKKKERKKEGKRDTHTHSNTNTQGHESATHNKAHECESSSLAVRPPGPDRTGSEQTPTSANLAISKT